MSGSLAVAEAGRAQERRELRVSERISCDVPASCQPPSDWKRGGQKWTARVRDISTGGLCLVLGRRFERGSGLAIEVPGSDPDSPSTLLARVMYVRAEGGGSWALGCAFVSPISDEELQTLTRSVAEDAPVEEEPDLGAASVADVYFRGALPGGRVIQRFIRKLNHHGHWPLPLGRTIGLRFPGPADGRSIARVRVDAWRPVGHRWVLECTFVGAPPSQLL